MQENKEHAHGKENEKYDKSEISLSGIFHFAIWMAVAALFIHGTMWVLLRYFDVRERERDKLPAPLASELNRVPPKPRLQPNSTDNLTPIEELKRFRVEEDEAVKSYGWADPKTGAVRIPIDKAIEQLTQKGLPARDPNAAQGIKDQGNEMPADSSAGRTLEKRLR